jgi:DNA-binding MarR family transcriptional regulator/ribosomal protein S18 acetylase RimI-like enzyme
LGEMMFQWSVQVYELYDIPLDVRFFPVFQAIVWLKSPTVNDIAEYVGLTHAAVSQILSSLAKQGFISLSKNNKDKRQTHITFTAKGKRVQQQMEILLADLEHVMNTAFAECATSPFSALQDYEQAMTRRSLLERIQDHRKQQMSERITITTLAKRGTKRRTAQLDAFKHLNLQWIEEYFTVEKQDLKALENAEEYIIKRGGVILCAEEQDGGNIEVLGAVALIPYDKQTVELAKMVVSPKARGRNLGFLLGEAALQKAREMGVTRVYLESNTTLQAAINLYYKLGFKRLPNFISPYERANIAMEILL